MFWLSSDMVYPFLEDDSLDIFCDSSKIVVIGKFYVRESVGHGKTQQVDSFSFTFNVSTGLGLLLNI